MRLWWRLWSPMQWSAGEGGCSERDKKRLNRLIKRASSVCGCPLDSIEVMGERRALAKLSTIMDNTSHPLHQTVGALSSSFSNRLRHPRCRKERFRRSENLDFLESLGDFLEEILPAVAVLEVFTHWALEGRRGGEWGGAAGGYRGPPEFNSLTASGKKLFLSLVVLLLMLRSLLPEGKGDKQFVCSVSGVLHDAGGPFPASGGV
ncbi:hypothetical protein L3Q82_008333 [Scortum barcoo]|uniref:Uncharacterized protein n=1 Tax=Scortum barcoo TaxID=214431 RepID=A0ACB8WHV3_9TELE|nr:hypothetical protein L3Q82_008333 [Scortum barcoo]